MAVVMNRKWIIGCLAAVNIVFFIVCWQYTFWQNSVTYDVKMQAVTKVKAAQQIIGERLLGEEYTPITTTLGAYEAKVLSTNPDFAAVIVDMLFTADIHKGDAVAVNMSGSFPALNIAAIAAVDALGAKPVIVSSIGASTWGANRPDFTWIDMERSLADGGLWPWRSSAVSIGGGGDQGHGLSEEGLQLIQLAIARSGVMFLDSSSLKDAISKRVDLYKNENDGSLPKILINVGGSHVIFGEHGHDASLHQGLTQGYHPSLAKNSGLAAAFINANRPVIHLININRLAAEYAIRSDAGQHSRVFQKMTLPEYLRIIIAFWIIGMLLLLYLGNKKAWWR